MATITSNDLKNGMSIEFDGKLFKVLEFQHVKPGKGAAFVRSRLRNLRTGAVIDHTFNAGEKLEQAMIEKRSMTYSYSMGDTHIFMDNETYEQLELNETQIKEELNFLIPEMEVSILLYGTELIGVELPDKVTLEVVDAEPSVKGNSQGNIMKNAKLETGFEIRVPLFIEAGEKIVVSTKTGEYDSRAK